MKRRPTMNSKDWESRVSKQGLPNVRISQSIFALPMINASIPASELRFLNKYQGRVLPPALASQGVKINYEYLSTPRD